jgi:PIN domain nuclease of toxin-antitoxin system
VTYLLDTGVWLWSVGEASRISRKAREVIADISHDVFLSAVTYWEVAIKAGSGKLRLPEPTDLYVPRQWQIRGCIRLLCLTNTL